MKKIAFLAFTVAAIATPIPPGPRPTPQKIDVSTYPAVELATKEAGSILIETSRAGLSIEMLAPDKRMTRSVSLDWRHSREVETILQEATRVVKFYDSDGDGLPNVRRIYERRGDRLTLISSEKLQWIATPDEFDPRSERK